MGREKKVKMGRESGRDYYRGRSKVINKEDGDQVN